ncbi:phosphoenolpyruvate carboxykinase (ATP) [Candidatus Peregrinibacteria bacterium CG10_big_fil_rev_8_21_14_0_10_49_16]|nr:MAG: phosphoenolpyruvate carboxykinase (ATP) [Candidatus Peregrinibacteria bacterium CG22_combo_CG10-13_8_21_14_all_49_11]PIR51968.1 MAG: phosphoenolpyruvate carboxykinase (ATP) [Candidatus Peregrinibacteria bacterium CG10_big_fil_rev_8_21_14_0_10_49_16]
MSSVATSSVSTSLLTTHPNIWVDPSRSSLVDEILTVREALPSASGALAVWRPALSTGRIPQNTYMVCHPGDPTIDWSFSQTCIPMEPNVFDEVWSEAQHMLSQKERLYVTHRSVGAHPQYALSVQTVTDSALSTLFTLNMFLDAQYAESQLGDPLTILVLPYDTVQRPGSSKALIAMDFQRRRGLVYGSSYLGSVKKLAFTVMNALLPEHGILPLHCSANEAPDGSTALFLGLSGTGKTTLSSDSQRKMIGDDEHLWSDEGIANMENGCYAKLIGLRKEKEPEIYMAVLEQGQDAIIENAMVYPDGTIDTDDDRFTENSRATYPLTSLQNVKKGGQGAHPSTIIFLTADASGVLPPIAKLNTEQAMLWFLLGYTSKLAGTEAGITKPKATFSRFFGGPFMPRKPQDYLDLFQQKLTQYGSAVYLVNTGWSGGPYGVGERMDIAVTRHLVCAALRGELHSVPYWEYRKFHVAVPLVCPGVDENLLNPKKMWSHPDDYDRVADALALEFKEYFEKNFLGLVSDAIAAMCPGR